MSDYVKNMRTLDDFLNLEDAFYEEPLPNISLRNRIRFKLTLISFYSEKKIYEKEAEYDDGEFYLLSDSDDLTCKILKFILLDEEARELLISKGFTEEYL